MRFNNALDRKETFFDYKKNFFLSQKPHFSKVLIENANFFICLFSLKIRLEMRFNNALDRKETFFDFIYKKNSKPQKLHFSKGVNP